MTAKATERLIIIITECISKLNTTEGHVYATFAFVMQWLVVKGVAGYLEMISSKFIM